MKKLLVAAMGIAAACGAFADPTPITALRFESASFEVGQTNTVSDLNSKHGGTYWTNSVSAADNTYVIESANPEGDSCPLPLGDNPTKALNVKTKFGNPLSVNVVDRGTAQTIGTTGIYFDSLVKFTVCDDCPTNQYEGAKIVLWLQEDEDLHKTNLYVNAGFLKYDNVNGVQVSNAIYKCGTTIGADFADKWHRVTIKAIANITTSTSTSVPGFAIFIDGSGTEVNYLASCNDAKWDTSFTDAFQFTDAVADLKTYSLFPSLDQTSGSKLTISNTSFDGTGSITDIAFYDVAPEAFAEDAVAAEVTGVIVDNVEQENIKTFAAAVEAANGASTSAKITLNKSFTIAEALAFSGTAEITLDFAGFVLTNELADAVITNSAATLIITNSSNTAGGIYCSGDKDALALVGGTTTIDAGVIGGKINPITNLGINGGYFAQDDMVLHSYLNNNRKKLSNDAGMTSLFGKNIYGLVDITYYTVTYNANGGDLQDDESVEVEEGSTVTKPEPPTRTGYTFAGWYYNDGTGLVPFRFDDDESEAGPVEVESDLTLTAQWDALPTYTITFVYGLAGEYSVQQIGILAGATPTLPADPETPYAVAGYNIAWPEFAAASASVTYTATYTGKTFTIVTYTNGVENTSKEFTYAGVSVDPADPLYDSATETWDGKFYTENGGSTEFAFDAAGELTQNAYATIETKGGSSDWDPVPSEIPDSKTAAQEYPALDGTPLATANAKKLTVWATANSVTLSDAKSATPALVESYLLNCAPANLEAEKAAFKLNISFDGSGNPVVTLPDGKAYNVTPTMKGSNDLSTWKVIDSTTGYQFFKYELSL